MERWQNKIAVVTAAGSGIGAATSKLLLEKGMIVVGLDICLDKMEHNVKPALSKSLQKKFRCLQCDIREEKNVREIFAEIDKRFGGIDVLINNAGILRHIPLLSPDNTEDMRNAIDTNVLSIVWCTREAFRIMKHNNVDGHIAIINGICGSNETNIPCQISKHAVTTTIEILRQELLAQSSKIRITSVSTGVCRTDILGEDVEDPSNIPIIKCEDVANAIVFGIQVPAHVQVHDIFLRPRGFNS